MGKIYAFFRKTLKRGGIGSVLLYVDEIVIYNRVLSDKEIMNHRYLIIRQQ